jgi:hypothetical protein
MQPSLVTARRLLLQLISPLIQELLDHFEAQPEFLRDVVYPKLRSRVGSQRPALWTVHLNDLEAPAVIEHFAQRGEITVGDLMRDARDRQETLAGVPMMLRRDSVRTIMPADNVVLQPDDEILVCSTRNAEQQIKTNLANIYTIQYLVSGTAPPRGYAMSWLASLRADSMGS